MYTYILPHMNIILTFCMLCYIMLYTNNHFKEGYYCLLYTSLPPAAGSELPPPQAAADKTIIPANTLHNAFFQNLFFIILSFPCLWPLTQRSPWFTYSSHPDHLPSAPPLSLIHICSLFNTQTSTYTASHSADGSWHPPAGY